MQDRGPQSGGEAGRGDADLVRRRTLQVMLFLLFQAAVLFFSAGRLDWISAWVFMGLYAAVVATNAMVILPRNAELLAERGQVREGAKSWDKVMASLVSLIGPLIILLVSGLDFRFGWSPTLTLTVPALAVLFFALGNGLWSWAMASNRFFSGVVRIQKERGHTVVTVGPYGYVRHPGYSGMIIFTLATPLLLGSLWALIPAGLTACLIMVRTALEDRTLQEELQGYHAYAARVRYRLLPRVW